jgi:glucokinase
MDNDANAAAYGEYRRGSGRGSKVFMCITLGTGVGGGIVADDRVFRGAHNYAGEIGHMTINERGPHCKCGNRGCLEAYVGTAGLLRSARAKLKKVKRSMLGTPSASRPLTPEVIAQAARRGDWVGRMVLEEAAGHLGTAIASVVNLLNPDCVALAGGVAGGFDVMRRPLQETVLVRAFPEPARSVTIRRGTLGFDAAPIGSALMARDAFSSGDTRLKGR